MKKILFTSIIIFNLTISWSQNFPVSGATWVFELMSPNTDYHVQKWEYISDSTTSEGVIKKFKVTTKIIYPGWDSNTNSVYINERQFLYNNDTIWDLNDTLRPLADFSLQVGDSSFTPFYSEYSTAYLSPPESCTNEGTELILQKGVVVDAGTETIDGINSKYYDLQYIDELGDTVITTFSERSIITEKYWHYAVENICGYIVDSGPYNLICFWDDSTLDTQCLSTIDWFDYLNTQEVEQPLQYSIYPIPVQNKLSIVFPNQQEYAIRITNLQGKEMLQQVHKNGNLTTEVDVSSLSSGVYLIIIEKEGGELIQKKWVKQ